MAEKKKKNKNLTAAKKAKNDEFFTRLEDICRELNYYNGLTPTGSINHFKDKVVLCNCNDTDSNFFKYFALNFKFLELKKLICVGYADGKMKSRFDPEGEHHAWKIEIDNIEDFNSDTAIDLEDAEWLIQNQPGVLTQLEGNGDFRSEECIELLKQADIVVTNSPFSLFRDFVAQLVQYQKQFIIIGNMNAITYKEVFPLIKDNKLWLGHTMPKDFVKPDGEIQSFGNICWFTNVVTHKRHENLVLAGNYSLDSTKYPKYENFDMIEVSKLTMIPRDYYGYMAVPITFIDKYNPDQFEIIGSPMPNILPAGWQGWTAEDIAAYKAQGGEGTITVGNRLAYYWNRGKIIVPYNRIIIRRQPGSSDGWTA